MTLQTELTEKAVASRRKLLKWGLLGVGAAVLATVPKPLMAQTSSSLTLTFNANDIGILNFALLLEELESAFYVAAVKSGKVRDPQEREYLRVLGIHEATHVTFLRKVLGSNVIFQTNDLSFRRSGLNALLKDRDTILKTAVSLEDTGVHAYNGAGTLLTDPTYILAAGSIVSVEARHAAGVRALLKRPVTELDRERSVSNANLDPSINPLKGRAYDELYTPKQIVQIVGSLKLINNPINGALVS